MRQGTAKSLLQFYTAAVREEKFPGLMINVWNSVEDTKTIKNLYGERTISDSQ